MKTRIVALLVISVFMTACDSTPKSSAQTPAGTWLVQDGRKPEVDQLTYDMIGTSANPLSTSSNDRAMAFIGCSNSDGWHVRFRLPSGFSVGGTEDTLNPEDVRASILVGGQPIETRWALLFTAQGGQTLSLRGPEVLVSRLSTGESLTLRFEPRDRTTRDATFITRDLSTHIANAKLACRISAPPT